MHLYPWTTKGPGGGTPSERLAGLEMARTVVNKVGLSKVPIWDTEVNYGNRRDNGHPEEVFGPKVGSAYLARTYIDSLPLRRDQGLLVRLGSRRSWASARRRRPGNVLAPGTAFFTLEGWLNGAKWGTCSDQRVTVCSLEALR